MKNQMKPGCFALLLLALAFPLGHAQNTDNLPAAPSATRTQKTAARPAAPKPAQAPATEAAPSSAGSASSAVAATSPAATDAAATAAAQTMPAAGHATAPAANENAEDAPLTTITKRVDEVNLVFTVTDRHGRFIKNLQQEDFKIFDDRKPARQIDWFARQTNLPLRVGLLVDASNSIRDRFKFEQESAVEFLAQTIRYKTDLAFVIGFDAAPEVTADFTSDTGDLARGVRALRPGGGTAMYDAIFFACRDKLMKAPQAGAVRRALVVISDGEDNQSRVTREDAIAMAQRAEVVVYAISTNTSGMKLKGDRVLERIAEATGGRAFFPQKLEDVATALMEIQDELRSQYAIAYKPADFSSDGRYRTIEVRAERHKDYKIRARKGYYAPKP
jgi:VWFA-related protein